MSAAQHSVDPVVERFVEQLGLEARAEDLARTAARVFGYLVIAGGPCTADELAEVLAASRGGISMSTQLLEARGLIERSAIRGDQRVRYGLAADPYGNLIETRLMHRRRIRDLVADTRRTLDGRPDAATRTDALARLSRMQHFYELLIEAMEAFQERWRAEQERHRAETP